MAHDKNANGKTDTGLFGIPKEASGVSNNARPRMRAPKYSEAAFEPTKDEVLTLDIGLK